MNYLVVGGAGFIGSNVVRKLVSEKFNIVTVFDNFSSGRMEFIEDLYKNKKIKLVLASLSNSNALYKAMQNQDVVIMLASNPDIAKAQTDPTIDFWEGTNYVQLVLEAMRFAGVKNIIFASGSGVYGYWPNELLKEDHSPMLPTSPYGASKLACEALISAYCNMFDMKARVYRLANVVGKNATHGVTRADRKSVV